MSLGRLTFSASRARSNLLKVGSLIIVHVNLVKVDGLAALIPYFSSAREAQVNIDGFLFVWAFHIRGPLVHELAAVETYGRTLANLVLLDLLIRLMKFEVELESTTLAKL